jgi:hypothetical protein
MARREPPRPSWGIPFILWGYTPTYIYIYIYIYMWEVFPYVGSLPICGKSSLGSLPMYAKSSHIQEDFPHVGRFLIYGESPHIWNKSWQDS